MRSAQIRGSKNRGPYQAHRRRPWPRQETPFNDWSATKAEQQYPSHLVGISAVWPAFSLIGADMMDGVCGVFD